MEFRSGILLCSAALLLICIGSVHGLAVMSVDLGSEWMKIGIVSPGVPLEIVLNKESKRKTPIAISFRDGERLVGEDALNVGVRFPAVCYSYFMDLLGKTMDNPMVKLFQKRFPYYNLVADEQRGTVLFKHDSETYFSPEELLGMLLSKAKDFAEEFSRQPVKEAVLTVPPYFNQAERRAVFDAAELAGLKVLQLMNTNTAVALNYGIFRRNDFNESAQYIVLYDMGASSTVATVIGYQIAKTKERGIVETNPQLTVLGVGYDRTLGGLEMQIRLRDFLAHAFNDMKKTSTDIFTNHRSLAKLFKEAGRVKNVLSANAGHYAQVEGLLDEKDFRLQISRDQFEKLSEDLFERVKAPVEKALNAAGLTMDLVDQVILVGAGTRVPKVQEKLTEFVKRELGKSLNTDEAAALGAAYKAADLSTGFKAKKFITKDAVLFPILVDFEREANNEDGSKTLKIIRRTLFSYMNPYPQKKILTFNKHVDDFTFYVSYGDLPLSKEEALIVGSMNITKVELAGVADALKKHGDEGEPKGVKAHFNMDESGLFSLSLVEAVFEKNATDTADGGVQDTLSKLGSAFSQLFTGSKDDETKERTDADGETDDINPKEEISDSDNQDKAGSSASGNVTENDTESANKSSEQPGVKEEDKSPVDKNKTESAQLNEGKKVKAVLVKETLASVVHTLDVKPLEGEVLKSSRDKLKTLNDRDRVRALRDRARNVLETFVIDMQNNINGEEYEKAVTDVEKEKILQSCSEISDWLYEDGSDADKEVYEEKLKSIRLLTKDLLDRVREHKERPDALEALDKMLNISKGFLDSSKLLSADEQLFTEVELSTLEKLVTEALTWREKKLKEQESTSLTEAPVLTISSIAEKINTLDREVKYMVNKARVVKLNKQKDEAAAAREKEKEKEKEAENKTKTGKDSESKTSEDENPVSGEASQDSNENKVDVENESAKNDSSPDSKNDDKVSPSKTTDKDDTHTEL